MSVSAATFSANTCLSHNQDVAIRFKRYGEHYINIRERADLWAGSMDGSAAVRYGRLAE